MGWVTEGRRESEVKDTMARVMGRLAMWTPNTHRTMAAGLVVKKKTKIHLLRPPMDKNNDQKFSE